MQERLLFIDDDQTMVDILQYYFPRHFECLCLTSPRAIEKHISAFSPHVILMDVFLDGFDGRQVCKEIKDDSKFTHIPIILTSERAFEQEELDPFKATGFIQKPFTHLDALTMNIKSYLQAKVVPMHNRRRLVTNN